MKHGIILAILTFATVGFSEAAVTINIRNFASTTEGMPIVDSFGVPVDQGMAFASVGTFGAGVSFAATSTPAEILALFTPVDANPVALNPSFDGLFSGQDIPNEPYASADIAGSAAYIVVGNAATLATSTLIAVYDLNAVFPTPDGVGNAAATFSATDPTGWVYGLLTPVTTQPSVPNAAFVTGIQLVTAIPEPSAMMLGAIGALGLLRRRR